MKKLNLLVGILIGFTIIACSSDDSNEFVNDEPILSKWIFKEYTFFDNNVGYVEEGILTDSIEYIINDNQIISFSGLEDMQDIPKTVTGNFTYEDNRLSQFERIENNQIVVKLSYSYDTFGELNEYKSQEWNSISQQFESYKSEYSHTSDTIYSNNYSGINDAQYSLESTAKIVLDNNLNRIYYENTDNGITGEIISTYDTSGNMISKNVYGTTYNYSYSSIINSQGIIYNNTFGKKVSMMTLIGGTYSPQLTSTNTIESITSNNDLNTFEFVIETDVNNDNYSIKTLYKEIVNTTPSDQEISEFIFE